MPHLNVYLASRFSRRAELNEYRQRLERAGIHVTARWLTDLTHNGIPDGDLSASVQRQIARDDLDDIDRSDVLIWFGDPPDGLGTRGGAVFEAGYAHGQGITVVIVGHRQNVFAHCVGMIFCPDAESAISYVCGLSVDGRGRVKVAA